MAHQSPTSTAAAANTKSISTSIEISRRVQRLNRQSLRASPGLQSTSWSRSLTSGCRMAGM